MVKKVYKIEIRGKFQRIRNSSRGSKVKREKEMSKDDEDKLYTESIKKLEKLADTTIDMCMRLAEKEDLEKDWVVDNFKKVFNSRIREWEE